MPDFVTCGYCKDCYWRNARSQCINFDKVDDTGEYPEENKKDTMKYSLHEGGHFIVGDLFGCVHFKAK